MSAALHLPHRVGARLLAVVIALVVVAGGLAIGARPAAAGNATHTATGRFAYVDDTGALIGIRNATVEMCNDDSPFCPTMARGTTDTNGFFTLTGTGGDPFDGPDPLVKVTATGPSGFIQPITLIDYCFRSTSFSNPSSTVLNFGTITPASGIGCNFGNGSTAGTDGAWQLWNNVREAWEFMRAQTLRNPGRDIPKVRVLWPDPFTGSAFYRGPVGLDDGAISVGSALAFRESVIFHEYGHHILQHFGESPLPNYNNGVCDSINFLNFGGHCFWRSEHPPVAWTEGWPDFLSEVLTTSLGKNETMSSVFACDNITPTLCGSVESPPLPSPDANLANVEGTVAAVLWDLLDANPDNRNADNSTDRLSLSFGSLWDVFQNRDPDPFTAHNKILSLDELWDAFAALRPAELNRVSEIYHENGLSKPASDLSVTAVSTSTLTVLAGQSIGVSDSTTNIGSVRTGTGSVTRLFLKQGRFARLTSLGSRTVGDLAPGGSSSHGTTNVTIPISTGPGDYVVVACADRDGTTFESNESNNCLDAGPITVTQPSISIGDNAELEADAAAWAMTFPVSLSAAAATPVSVNYGTTDGTARAAGDYTATIGTVTFAPGETTKMINVPVNDDLLDEAGNETFNVALSGPIGATISDGAAVGYIVDDDAPPTLRINNVGATEGQSGTKDFTFNVALSAVSGQEVRVNWTTANWHAQAGSDFVAGQGTLVIPAGTASRDIVVRVQGDQVREANELFSVKLSAPVSATFADDWGIGTIVNDD